MTNLKHISTNIHALRKDMNITQQEAAQKAGISTNYWNWIENGKRVPKLSTLETIANVLGVKLSRLFEEKE